MNEQISLNGAPVIGFGDQGTDYQAMWAHQKATIPGTIAGFFVGAIGGSFLGNAIHKGAVGAAAGAISGGVAGTLAGNVLASHLLREPPPKNCDDLSPAEQKVIFEKAKANLEAAGTPFDASWMSDPTKFGAFMTEVSKVSGCRMPNT